MKEVKKAKSIAFVLMISALSVTGQGLNNSIFSKSELILNTSSTSSTANNTVEWNCINKSLTQKCLVYHNDQWFHFTPERDGKLYINISAQVCRDSRGVQMIVIEGNPCEIQTYRILKCIPKIYQNDVFVELDSLKARALYLINIDGYLGDFCKFDITLSDKPKGLPHQHAAVQALNFKTTETELGVELRWEATDQQLEEIARFEIYRQKSGDVKAIRIAEASTRSNALGKHDRNYFQLDTVYTAGNYRYTILAVKKTDEERIVLDESTINFQPFVECIAELSLTFERKGSLQISIMDPDRSRTLHTFSYDYLQDQRLPIDLSHYALTGTRRFWIRVRHDRLKETKMFAFAIDAHNRFHAVTP